MIAVTPVRIRALAMAWLKAVPFLSLGSRNTALLILYKSFSGLYYNKHMIQKKNKTADFSAVKFLHYCNASGISINVSFVNDIQGVTCKEISLISPSNTKSTPTGTVVPG